MDSTLETLFIVPNIDQFDEPHFDCVQCGEDIVDSPGADFGFCSDCWEISAGDLAAIDAATAIGVSVQD